MRTPPAYERQAHRIAGRDRFISSISFNQTNQMEQVHKRNTPARALHEYGDNVRDKAILWAKRLSWEIQGQAKSATASASCVRGDRGRNGFRQINDELVIPVGQQCIPETVSLCDSRLRWIEVQVKSFRGRRSHGIAPIVDHPIGRNAVDDLPIP